MYNKIIKNVFLLFWLLALISLLANTGCQFRRKGTVSNKASSLKLARIVVFGFRPALKECEGPTITRCPIGDGTFEAGPVSLETARNLTRRLYKMCAHQKRYELIGPEQAQAAYLDVLRSHKNTPITFVKALAQMGKDLEADAVLAGFIYRWRERQGGDLAVTDPASVAFDLHLISTLDGVVIWTSEFDKTQKPLLENLLDIGTFIKGKGHWMTAEELATLGLQEMLEKMPSGRAEE